MITTQTTDRPKISDDAIILAAAKKLAPKVKEWLGKEDDSELAEIEEELEKAIRWENDGYEIAKNLDNYCFPDAALVEILDDAARYKSDALREACTEWVNANKIQPIPLQTEVRWPRKPEASVGIVVANHPEGKSTVRFPALGHVPSGQLGTQGYIVEWEQLVVERGPTK